MEIAYTIIYFGVLIGIMYLIIFLPQRRREKKNREMLNTLQVGLNVTTIGGVMGKVMNIKDDEITIESGIEKTKLKVRKWAIKEVEKPIEG